MSPKPQGKAACLLATMTDPPRALEVLAAQRQAELMNASLTFLEKVHPHLLQSVPGNRE